MDTMHLLADRCVPALLDGSLALSARPHAPVLPARPARRNPLRAVATTIDRRRWSRPTGVRLARGVGRRAPIGG